MKRILITTALLAGVFSYAGGFRVSLQGVKQLAMAHTSAHTEDASVAFFNPAGISFIPSKLSVAVGGFGAISEVEYQSLETLQSYKTENPVGTPLYAAIAYKVTNNVSVGLSVTTPFGSTVKWANDWAGKEIVQKMELKSFFFQPMISFKLNDWVSIGASYIYAKGLVDWDKSVTNLGGTLNINDEKATGSGFGLGFYFKPDDKLDVSIAYRSQVTMKAENGVATFSGVSSSILTSPQLNVGADGQDAFTAELPLVDEYTIGLTYKITPKWLVSADFNYHGWEKYNKLTLDFENAQVGNQTDKTILVSPKNFHNAKTFRIGTQYMLTNNLAGRLGYYYDESPYTDQKFIPETPSFNANVLTAGLGYKFGKLGVDLAAALSFPEARKVNNYNLNLFGQAKAKATYLGLGFSYNAF
ncbi:aromatic hydrocarbon degradation protein [Cloacibacterium normanense]|jgi:long-chain fatty acid transport protein|uniref:Aromatic hydrocarbon degradation protein n=1 Tax=Cloacibacterium normanense TaxID=237258 RepID=A0A2S7I6F9_9FLAO|nr:outer membrane protein transport protein [Cloacibacterium normanense]PPZ92162.1 aromatic hydrocarbon degradation protein [Cloacibacterium normanense]